MMRNKKVCDDGIGSGVKSDNRSKRETKKTRASERRLNFGVECLQLCHCKCDPFFCRSWVPSFREKIRRSSISNAAHRFALNTAKYGLRPTDPYHQQSATEVSVWSWACSEGCWGTDFYFLSFFQLLNFKRASTDLFELMEFLGRESALAFLLFGRLPLGWDGGKGRAIQQPFFFSNRASCSIVIFWRLACCVCFFFFFSSVSAGPPAIEYLLLSRPLTVLTFRFVRPD